MCSAHTSGQHLVVLQKPTPFSSCACTHRLSSVPSGRRPRPVAVATLCLLQPVDDVEHHLALVALDRVVLQPAAVVIAAPDPHLRLIRHQLLLAGWLASSSAVKYFSNSSMSTSSSRSSRIGTWS